MVSGFSFWSVLPRLVQIWCKFQNNHKSKNSRPNDRGGCILLLGALCVVFLDCSNPDSFQTISQQIKLFNTNISITD